MSPTVKSHIFPRALMFDLRGSGSYVHQVHDDSVGTNFRQSGPFDDKLLCLVHERQTQKADKYGAEFCRRVVQNIPQFGVDDFLVNPGPELLAKFAYQSIWRFAASNLGHGLDSLGPYESVLRSVIFDDSPPSLPFMITRNHLRISADSEAMIALAPFPTRLGGVRVWLFMISGAQFYVKLDKRNFAFDGDRFSALGRTVVHLFELEPRLILDTPILQTLIKNMLSNGSKFDSIQ